MEIRPVKPEEIEEVLGLIDQYDRPRAPRPNNEELQVIYSSIVRGGGCVVGAFVGSLLVGTCTVNVCPNLSWSGRPYAIIENVIVSKDYRRRGIGKAVLQFAKELAQRVGCYKVALMTGSKEPATYRFYESAGFVANKQGFQVRFNA